MKAAPTLEAIAKALNARIPGKACPLCGYGASGGIKTWTLISPEEGPVIHLTTGGATTIPAFVLACANCGYMAFLSPRVLGWLDVDGNWHMPEKES